MHDSRIMRLKRKLNCTVIKVVDVQAHEKVIYTNPKNRRRGKGKKKKPSKNLYAFKAGKPFAKIFHTKTTIVTSYHTKNVIWSIYCPSKVKIIDPTSY